VREALSQGEVVVTSIVVAGTFTTDLLRVPLSRWLNMAGIDAHLSFAPYNQIVQQLLDADSVVSRNTQGVNVLLLGPDADRGRASGALRGASDTPSFTALDDVIGALEIQVGRSAVQWIVACCPGPPPRDGHDQTTWVQSEARLAERLQARQGCHVIRSTDMLGAFDVPDYYAEYTERLAAIPYTPVFFAAIAGVLVRRIHALLSPPRKVIVLDCDNTLWSGTCGEDGPSAVIIDGPRQRLHQFLLDRKEAGFLLCLCSKNEEPDVWAVFDTHPGVRVRKGDLVGWRINWANKSANLQSLANELQLGLDSFIFIDDDAVECAEVMAHAPDVLTLQLPPDADEARRLLEGVWAFDRVALTAEDAMRTAHYQRDQQRSHVRTRTSSIDEFVQALAVTVSVRAPKDSELARIAQLTLRTNQFNCTLTRRTDAELRAMSRDDRYTILAVHASDRYGDYGLVGAVILRREAAALDIETFLLSCRALGRRIEDHMMRAVEQLAQDSGCGTLRLRFREGPRNTIARTFLDHLDSSWTPHAIDGAVEYRRAARERQETRINHERQRPLSTFGHSA
jgi:FkbH-like protein